jgi:predicted AAA+ superfamily ATPase
VKRVALVGTYLKAGSPLIKDDGTEVRTLWGELAWQLGGREAYDLIAEDDRAGTNPGEALRTLTAKYSPALILIDEWVAYARQLVTDKELPSGSFETQFTFAQSLTEVVRSVPGAMLVVSIPASDTGDAGSGSDIEIGGANGQLALERLQNVIRRVADQWRPSSKDESFEIVRRRLFQAPNAEGLTTISAVARSFVTLYRSNTALFPRDAAAPVTTTSSASGRRTRYTPSCWIVCTRTGPRWSGSSARAVCSSSCHRSCTSCGPPTTLLR